MQLQQALAANQALQVGHVLVPRCKAEHCGQERMA